MFRRNKWAKCNKTSWICMRSIISTMLFSCLCFVNLFGFNCDWMCKQMLISSKESKSGCLTSIFTFQKLIQATIKRNLVIMTSSFSRRRSLTQQRWTSSYTRTNFNQHGFSLIMYWTGIRVLILTVDDVPNSSYNWFVKFEMIEYVSEGITKNGSSNQTTLHSWYYYHTTYTFSKYMSIINSLYTNVWSRSKYNRQGAIFSAFQTSIPYNLTTFFVSTLSLSLSQFRYRLLQSC